MALKNGFVGWARGFAMAKIGLGDDDVLQVANRTPPAVVGGEVTDGWDRLLLTDSW